MDKTIRRYTGFAEMKADEYRYWQRRPAHERLDAVEEVIQSAYALKGGPTPVWWTGEELGSERVMVQHLVLLFATIL